MSSNSKAQVAIEFVILVGVLFFVMILFLAFIRNYMVDVRSDKDNELLKDIAYAVQAEVNIAISAGDGYERDFEIPLLIESTNYSINITQDQVWATTENAEVLLAIPSIQGNLTKGDNTIRNMGGQVYLNAGAVNDSTAPIVTLMLPSDDSDQSMNITFMYWASDADSGIRNCSIIIDQTLNQTDISVDEGVWQYFEINHIPSGGHNWTINCTDNSQNNNSAQPSEWSFNV